MVIEVDVVKPMIGHDPKGDAAAQPIGSSGQDRGGRP
jgi:hypothetical protein